MNVRGRAEPIDAVIFDCDGTLVDSEPLGFEAIGEALAAHGYRLPPGVDLIDLKGRRMASSLAEVGRRVGRALPPDFEVVVREHMARAFHARLRPIPGAAETLAALRVPFCVASNGPREKMELTLGLSGLLHYVENRLFSAYEVGSWKPDPGLFLHAAEAMGVAPQHCAVVEDSESGLRAGLAAGMRVYAFCPVEELPPELRAQVRSLARLTDLLRVHRRPGD